MKKVAELYYKNLQKHPAVLNYLVLERKLTPESIHNFRLGYASHDIYMEKVKSVELERDDRLIFNNHDSFNGYITFPIFFNGNVVGIYGRNFNNNLGPSHLHSATPKDTLYNMTAFNKSSVILVESPIDCITMVQNGFNCVASFGAGVKKTVAKFFKDKVCYVLYDKDEAGYNGAQQVIRKIGTECKRIHIIIFPGKYMCKMDANQYFLLYPKGARTIKSWIKKSRPISVPQFIVKKYEKKNSDIKEDKIDIVRVGKLLFDNYIDKGNSILVRCPFHKEGTEENNSLLIGGKLNIYYCFGCQNGGGPIRLVRWITHLSHEGAIEWLRQNFNV